MCHPPMYYKTTTRDGRMKRTSLQATCSLAAKCWPTFAKMTDILTRPTFSSLDSCIIISSSSITYISHCQIQATKGPNTKQQKILEFHFGIFVESSGHSVSQSVIIACDSVFPTISKFRFLEKNPNQLINYWNYSDRISLSNLKNS